MNVDGVYAPQLSFSNFKFNATSSTEGVIMYKEDGMIDWAEGYQYKDLTADSFTFVLGYRNEIEVKKVADKDVVKTLDMTGGAAPAPLSL